MSILTHIKRIYTKLNTGAEHVCVLYKCICLPVKTGADFTGKATYTTAKGVFYVYLLIHVSYVGIN